MKIIFLDIDGVLTTENTKYQYGDITCMKFINSIVEQTRATVVLTSERRYGQGIQQKLKDWGATWYVYSKLPVAKESKILTVPSRGQLIKQWFYERGYDPDSCNFVIIDDNSVDGFEDYTIVCDPKLGLQYWQTSEATHRLNS